MGDEEEVEEPKGLMARRVQWVFFQG
jgi:hypothetical protein